MKTLRRLLAAVVVVVIVVIALLVTVFSPDHYKDTVEQRLSAAFGRPAHVGAMRYTLLRGFGVEASDVVVDEDASFGAGPLLSVKSVWADLGLWNLVTGRGAVVEQIVFESPELQLVKRQDGVWNWTTLGTKPAEAPAAARIDRVPTLMLAGAAVPVSVAAATTPDRVVFENASVSTLDLTIDPGVKFEYRGMKLDTTVERQDTGYVLVGSLAGDSAASGGEPCNVDVQFNIALTPPEAAAGWHAYGTIPSGRLATRNLRIDRVTTNIALVGGKSITFDQFKASLYGGSMEADVAIDVTSSGNRFTATCNLDGISVGDFLAARPDMAGGLGGTLTATFAGTGRLGALPTTLGSLEGNGRVTLQNAVLGQANVLDELARKGGLTGGAFGADGTTAERFESEYAITQGRAVVDGARIAGLAGVADITVESGAVSLASPSSLALTGTLSLRPQFFTTLEAANPNASTMLRMAAALPPMRLPVAVDGPLTKPAVTVGWPSLLPGRSG